MNERRPEFGHRSGPTGDNLADRLAEVRGPAVVVAPDEALLLAANPAGATTLGVTAAIDTAVPLDSAMPAIMDLRRMSASIPSDHAGAWLPLVFWTPNGIARLSCRLRRLATGDRRRLVLIELESGATAAAETATSPLVRSDDAPLTAAAAIEKDVSRPSGVSPASAPMRVPEPTAPAIEEQTRLHPPPAAVAASPPTTTSPSAADPADEQSPPPPPLVRNDHDTLKAIARQILAGRRPSPPPDRTTHPADTRTPFGPATADEPIVARTPPMTPAVGETRVTKGRSDPAAATVPAAIHKPATGTRRATAAAAVAPASSSEPPSSPRKVGKSNPQRNTSRTQHTSRPEAENPSHTTQGGEPRRTMVRRLAHELKTPVSAIVTAAEIMKDERFGPIGDERYLRYARDIYASARHALDVIERLLGQQDGPSQNRELSFTDVDLAALVASLASSFEMLAHARDVSIDIDMPAHLPRVVADATSIRQIILNLLSNALKFTPHGGHIEISVTAATGPLILAVTDTGPGMSDAEIARIAAGIEAPASERKRSGGGLGIGLPLARSLAKANGANLHIETGRTQGTRVALEFPSGRLIVG